MDLHSLLNFGNEAIDEVSKSNFAFTLSPQKMINAEHSVGRLGWNPISCGGSY